jgi:hypothetical protein
MKLKSDLTKRYYLPIVEGSNYGKVFGLRDTYNAFVTYIRSEDGNLLTKVTNYSQIWHWFSNRPVMFRKGYQVKWWEGGGEVIDSLSKANKYLNRQYVRIDKHLRKGDKIRAVAIWMVMHRRSKIWMLVLIIRKLPILSMPVLRYQRLTETIGKLIKKRSYALKFKRVFLPEYKVDGTIKKYRPLGVPEMEWRVIAASFEFMLCNLWAGDWSKNQYACMPNRGVADAWIEILTRLTRKGEDRVTQIIGYDLAKFFDSVELQMTETLFDQEKYPRGFVDWLTGVKKCVPKIDPKDYEKERKRIVDLISETQYLNGKYTYLGVYRMLYHFSDPGLHGGHTPRTGYPQGLNVSPILSCRVLQWTGALDHPNIVQYVDDGLIMNTVKSVHTLDEFEGNLLTNHTGLTISKSKTEMIMEDGKYLKPLKFLGCSYDGKTFRAATRKGVYEVKDAANRIDQVIDWLSKNGSLLGDYKKMFTSLLAEGWNPPKAQWWNVPAKLDQTWYGFTLNPAGTWWEGTKAKVERLSANSVEAMAVTLLGPKLGPITSSSNTATMVCSYYLLKYGRFRISKLRKAHLAKYGSSKVKATLTLPPVITSRLVVSSRLIADW